MDPSVHVSAHGVVIDADEPHHSAVLGGFEEKILIRWFVAPQTTDTADEAIPLVTNAASIPMK